ncbi:MAG TPA: hypothetical protein ENI64_02700 [Gammaproteobacteria bacterium]|nr:hypothetical protein [Gammaproteobacteria bacterium]
MTRDYKNSGSKHDKRPAIPGWVWGFTGLVVGLLVALLVYLSEHIPQRSTSLTTAVEKAAEKASKAITGKKSDSDAEPSSKSKVQFEFYTLLPESEVVIPEQELVEDRVKPASKKPAASMNYMLQTGSFRQSREAETLKARLALLGIESHVQNVSIGGEDWHRVRAGPYNSMKEVRQVRGLLRRNKINAIPIKVSGRN